MVAVRVMEVRIAIEKRAERIQFQEPTRTKEALSSGPWRDEDEAGAQAEAAEALDDLEVLCARVVLHARCKCS